MSSAPESAGGHHGLAGLAHADRGALEDFLPLEHPVRVAERPAAIGVGEAHAVHLQDAAHLAVAAEPVGQYAFLAVGRLQHDRGAAVAEQHGNVPVHPVHHRRDQLAADHERASDGAGLDHRARGREAVQEAGAGGVDVHRAGAGGAQLCLQAGGHVGHLLVHAAGAEHDQVEVPGVEAGAGQRPARRHLGHLAEGDVGDPPFVDAGPAPDPLVVRIQEGREVGIGQNGGGHALAPARNSRKLRHSDRIVRPPTFRPAAASKYMNGQRIGCSR